MFRRDHLPAPVTAAPAAAPSAGSRLRQGWDWTWRFVTVPRPYVEPKRYLPAAFFAFLPLFFYLSVTASVLGCPTSEPVPVDARLNGGPCLDLLARLDWGILVAGQTPTSSLALLSFAFHHAGSVEMWLWLTAVCALMAWVEDRQGSFITEGVLALSAFLSGWTTWWMAPVGTPVLGSGVLFYGLIGACMGELLINPLPFKFVRWALVGICLSVLATVGRWMALACLWATLAGLFYALVCFSHYASDDTPVWRPGFLIRVCLCGLLLCWVVAVGISFGLTV